LKGGRRGLAQTLIPVIGPAAEAAALIFEHTKTLAGRPENRRPLRELRRMIGGMIYAKDAWED